MWSINRRNTIMSSARNSERNARAIVKLLQFFASVYLIFALYNIGPYWILLIACLAIPVYGVYLLWKSPDRRLKHPLPYVRYKALAQAKSWLRVDLSICITMAVVCFGFSLVLLFGYFAHNLASPFLLQAAAASMLLCILYLLNAFLTARQLNMGTIDFVVNGQQETFATRTSNRSPLAVETTANFDGFPSSTETLDREHDRMLTLPRLVPVYERPRSSNENPTMLERLQSELDDQRQILDQHNQDTVHKNVKYSVASQTIEKLVPKNHNQNIEDERSFAHQYRHKTHHNLTVPPGQVSPAYAKNKDRFTQTEEISVDSFVGASESHSHYQHEIQEYAVDVQEMHLSSTSAKSPEVRHKSTSQPYNRRAMQPKQNVPQAEQFGQLNVNTVNLVNNAFNSAKLPIIASPTKSTSKDPMSSLQGDQNTTTNSTSTEEETEERNRSHFKRPTNYPLMPPLSKQKAWAIPAVVRPVILDNHREERKEKSLEHLDQQKSNPKNSAALRYYRIISPATQKKIVLVPMSKSTKFPVELAKDKSNNKHSSNEQLMLQVGENRNSKKGFDVTIRPQTVPLCQSTELKLAEENVSVKTVSRAEFYQATEF